MTAYRIWCHIKYLLISDRLEYILYITGLDCLFLLTFSKHVLKTLLALKVYFVPEIQNTILVQKLEQCLERKYQSTA